MLKINYNNKRRGQLLFLVVVLILNVSCSNKKNKTFQLIETELVQKPQDVVFGSNDASHTLFLYASYNCKFCRYLFLKTFPKLKENYLDKGILKVVIKWTEFSEDEKSMYSLNVGSCVYQHGTYETYHKLLLTNPTVIAGDDFQELVFDLMEDNNEIAECILNNTDYSYLRNNIKEFRKLGFTGTPTMVMNKHAYGGYVSFEHLNSIIKKEFNL